MKKILNIAVFAFLITGFSSCLKDETMIGPDSPNAVQHVVEFLNPAVIVSSTTSTIPIYALSYDIKPSAELDVQVSYSGKGTAPNDIKVKVELAPAAIDKANEEQESEMVQLPDSVFTIPSFDVTIPKGQKTGILKINLSPDKFDLTEDYALALKIVSVSGTNAAISGNFGTILMNIGAKNPWDGRYQYKTSANTSLIPNQNREVTLVTVGPTKVQLLPGLLANYSNLVYYIIDPVTNLVTVECPSLGVQTPQDPRSHYDPNTKVLKVYWKQGNGGRTFEETLTYLGPR